MRRKNTKKQQRVDRQQSQHFNNVLNKLKIKEIIPLTDSQEKVYDCFEDGKNIVLHGLAGTGKSYISLYLALDEILNAEQSDYKKVLIIRSVVPSRDIGYLPGSMKDKIKVYEAPYENICNDLFNDGNAYQVLKSKQIVEFQSTSFMRGLTFDNCIIIIDEIQNMTAMELHTVLTRIGKNSRFMMCGDYRQGDLSDKKGEQSGLKQILQVLNKINSVDVVEFGVDDIVRSGFVKEYILARHRVGLV